VTRFRLSRPAQADLAAILEASADRWGAEGRRRYASILAAAMRRVANEPTHSLTRDRSELLRRIRSFHIRHARSEIPSERVKAPVHVIYYRPIEPRLIEIVRVLREHMEPRLHIRKKGQ
jgi:toxin ParE1/3/4